MMTRVISHGKVILSGEHAVVYGCPACALAVNKRVQGEYTLRTDGIIRLICRELGIEESMTRDDVMRVYHDVVERYNAFQSNNLPILQVLQSPLNLCWATIASLLKKMSPDMGCDIHLTTTIPVGCGMGSSAAVIVNLLLGINELFNLTLSDDRIFILALEAENWQHGYSSGLDIHLALRGGVQVFQKNQRPVFLKINALPFDYVNSGAPESSTGECVAFVREQCFSNLLWQEFEKTTLAVICALKSGNQHSLLKMIKKNHRLLCQIGVVPSAIQAMIADIEEAGGAAKICGAGSIRGNAAGMILIIPPIGKKIDDSSPSR
ncbi:MAG: hypothetical protein LRY67_02195 [Gammaproteobacteria bacterium]|nr:hypothetical protein [Gammaproteobacteria bacterium]MCD8542891.1 hypothetical protein [Gammaproteobacteria bacterium]